VKSIFYHGGFYQILLIWFRMCVYHQVNVIIICQNCITYEYINNIKKIKFGIS